MNVENVDMTIGTIVKFVFNLALTALLYGLFPLIFAYTWKNQITKRMFFIICWAANFIVFIIIAALISLGGEKATGGGYLLWTLIFSNIGYKNLLKKKIAVESVGEITDIDGSDERFMYYCPKCGTVYSQCGKEKDTCCTNCNSVLYNTSFNLTDWQKLSVAEKESKKLEWFYRVKDIASAQNSSPSNTLKSSTLDTKPINRFSKNYCNKCGNKLSEGSLFCSNCGVKVE